MDVSGRSLGLLDATKRRRGATVVPCGRRDDAAKAGAACENGHGGALLGGHPSFREPGASVLYLLRRLRRGGGADSAPLHRHLTRRRLLIIASVQFVIILLLSALLVASQRSSSLRAEADSAALRRSSSSSWLRLWRGVTATDRPSATGDGGGGGDDHGGGVGGDGDGDDAEEQRELAPDVARFHALDDDELRALGDRAHMSLRVVVLSMNRASALRRLLLSVRDALYDGDRVSLTIWVDLRRHAREHDAATLAVAKEFDWPHGEKLVRLRERPMGLMASWLASWTAADDAARDDERAVILEDDLEVSPLYYRWLKAAVASYDDLPDVAGYTLQRLGLIATTGKVSGVAAAEGEGAFLYRLVGTWGFSPQPQRWADFQRWYAELRRSNASFVPHVDGLAINRWYHGREWSNWFMRFCEERDQYVVHARIDERKVTLAGNWREPGEHYGTGPALGLDFAPLRVDDGVKFRFPRRPLRVGWDGELSAAHHSAFQRDFRAPLRELVEYATLRHGGRLSVSVVNYYFADFVRSFLCNLDMLRVRPRGLAWVTNDEDMQKELRRDHSFKSVRMDFAGGGEFYGNIYGTPGYWMLMINRARLVLELLRAGVTPLLFDVDQVWLRDPMPYVQRVLRDDPRADVVGVLTCQNEVGGNFLYLRPTRRVLRMYARLVELFQEQYDRRRLVDYDGSKRITIQNDQTLLTALVHSDNALKREFGVRFRSLDRDKFPDGRWYKGAYRKRSITHDPVLINNNFVQGNDVKIRRAMSVGHWFFNNLTGRCEKPESVKFYAEDGKHHSRALLYPWERTALANEEEELRPPEYGQPTVSVDGCRASPSQQEQPAT